MECHAQEPGPFATVSAGRWQCQSTGVVLSSLCVGRLSGCQRGGPVMEGKGWK